MAKSNVVKLDLTLSRLEKQRAYNRRWYAKNKKRKSTIKPLPKGTYKVTKVKEHLRAPKSRLGSIYVIKVPQRFDRVFTQFLKAIKATVLN